MKKTSIAAIILVLALFFPLSFSKADICFDQASGSTYECPASTVGGQTPTPSSNPGGQTPAPASNPGGQTPTPASGVGGQTPTPASTVGGNNGGGTQTFYLQNPLDPKFNSVGGLVQGALEIFSYLVVIFAVLALIYVGLQFVLAQGNPSRMNELKNWLLWIVVGVAIVIGARIIVSVVISTLEDSGVVSTGVTRSARGALQATSPAP